ncbi:hypothetical protein ACQEVY_09965 [Streptomyces sp. CA-288835]|uniref:hypothetical protein n=1 Tax=Streptomyces sp. CA-288835 TaxID=3240069 RepID=UPI003D8E3E37
MVNYAWEAAIAGAGALFSGGRVNFHGAKFCGGYVNFTRAKFSGGEVVFSQAKISGGTLDFSGATGPAPIDRIPLAECPCQPD